MSWAKMSASIDASYESNHGSSRCAGARAAVQGNNHAASHGLLGRMQGARAVKGGRSKGGNSGSNAFHAMQQSEHSGGANYADGSGCIMNPSNECGI